MMNSPPTKQRQTCITPPGFYASKNAMAKHDYGITPPGFAASKNTSFLDKIDTVALKKTDPKTRVDKNEVDVLRKERDDAVLQNEKLKQLLEETRAQLAFRDEFDKEGEIIHKKEIGMLQNECDVAMLQNRKLKQQLEETQAQLEDLTSHSKASRTHQMEMEFLRSECDNVVLQNIELERHVQEIRAQLAACRDEFERDQKKYKKHLAFLLNEQNRQGKQEPPEEGTILGPINHDLVETTERIGDYDIGKFLGKGEYAQVRKGIHRNTHEQYAIKCIGKKRSPQAMHQLEQEVIVLTQVTHPNMIRAMHVYHAPSTVYLVMELGRLDLFEYAQRTKGRIDDNTLREIMIGILQPIEFLHSIGICHSDLKAENILIMKKASQLDRTHIKLCDFGLCSMSTSTDPDTPVYQTNFKGTVPLVAPEVIVSTSIGAAYDARPVDMWAIGCTLLELTVGYPDGWKEAFKLHKTDIVGFEEGIHESLESMYERRYMVDFNTFDIVCSLLRMKPEARHTASQVLEHGWFEGCFMSSKARGSV